MILLRCREKCLIDYILRKEKIKVVFGYKQILGNIKKLDES